MLKKTRSIPLLLLLSLVCIFNLQAQKSKEDRFKKTVYNLIKYYNNKDSEKFNKLIHPKVGCYVLSTPGAQIYWQNTTKIPLDDNCDVNITFPVPIYDILTKQKLSSHFKLKYDKYPKINGEYPSKKGLFVDTTKVNREISTHIKWLAETYDNDDTGKEFLNDYKTIYMLETNTRKVILVSDEADNNYYSRTFIFYLTDIKNNWYLTMIDFTDFFLTE